MMSFILLDSTSSNTVKIETKVDWTAIIHQQLWELGAYDILEWEYDFYNP
jgi:hypothetical protein